MRAKDRETRPRNEARKYGDKKAETPLISNRSYCQKGHMFRFSRIPITAESSYHSHDGTTRLSERGLASCRLESHTGLPLPIWNSPNDQRCRGEAVQACSVVQLRTHARRNTQTAGIKNTPMHVVRSGIIVLHRNTRESRRDID